MTLLPILGAPAPLATTIFRAAAVTIAPTYGDELLTNGGFEDGDPPTGWTYSANAIASQQADPRTGSSGSYCVQIENGAANSQNCQQVAATGNAKWVLTTAYIKKLGTVTSEWYFAGNVVDPLTMLVDDFAADWSTQAIISARSTDVSVTVRGKVVSDVLGKQGRWDDASCKIVSDISTCFSTEKFLALNGWGEVKANRGSTCTPIGIAYVVDASNFVIGHIHPANISPRVELLKCVGGTYTRVGSTATITYTAGQKIKLLKSGTSFSVYYNDVEKIAPQTISDSVFASGGYFRCWTTYGSNIFTDFEVRKT